MCKLPLIFEIVSCDAPNPVDSVMLAMNFVVFVFRVQFSIDDFPHEILAMMLVWQPIYQIHCGRVNLKRNFFSPKEMKILTIPLLHDNDKRNPVECDIYLVKFRILSVNRRLYGTFYKILVC